MLRATPGKPVKPVMENLSEPAAGSQGESPGAAPAATAGTAAPTSGTPANIPKLNPPVTPSGSQAGAAATSLSPAAAGSDSHRGAGLPPGQMHRLAQRQEKQEERFMISEFFIERPIFANVIAVVTVIIGMVCFYNLPVAQYPPIVPPTIR